MRKEQANKIVDLEIRMQNLEYPLGGPCARTLAHARKEWSYNDPKSNDQINKELDQVSEWLQQYENVMKEEE